MDKMKKITPEGPEVVKESKKKWYPSLHLKLKDIPEAKNWDIGKSYMLIVGVKFTSIREDENGSDIGFDVLKIKPLEKGKY